MGCGPSKFKGEGQRLGSGPASPTTVTRPPAMRPPMAHPNAPAAPAPARTRPPAPNAGGNMVGSSSPPSGDAAKRAAAAAAAERRAQEGATRGTSSTNANQGRLASQLEKQKRGHNTEVELPKPMVWD